MGVKVEFEKRAMESKKYLVVLWSLLAFSTFVLVGMIYNSTSAWGWIPVVVAMVCLAFIVVAFSFNQSKLDSLVRVAAIGAAAASGKNIPGAGGTPPDPGSGVASPDAGDAPTSPGE